MPDVGVRPTREPATRTDDRLAFGDGVPTWRLLVAPFSGTFEPHGDPAHASVVAGSVLGRIRAARVSHLVLTPYDGVVVEWLALGGDPVAAHQPVARVQPATDEAAAG